MVVAVAEEDMVEVIAMGAVSVEAAATKYANSLELHLLASTVFMKTEYSCYTR